MIGSIKRNENLTSQRRGLKKGKGKTAPQGGKVEGKVGYLLNSHGRQKSSPLLVRTTAFHKPRTLKRFSNEVVHSLFHSNSKSKKKLLMGHRSWAKNFGICI